MPYKAFATEEEAELYCKEQRGRWEYTELEVDK